jgi:hypothetical protein
MFCSFIVEPKSDATSYVEEGGPSEPPVRRSKAKLEWAEQSKTERAQQSEVGMSIRK